MERTRFKDALWYNKKPGIVIGGAGGIGSWVTFFLTKAGFGVTVYDFDTVENHNLGGQLFLADSVGQPKVLALANTISEFNGVNFELAIKNERITADTTSYYFIYGNRCPKIFISCFDNMQARKDFFNGFIKNTKDEKEVCYFVDGRLLMEQMRIYCVAANNSTQIEDYVSNHLFDDSEVEDLPCSMKQTSHAAAMIASHMTGFITNIISNIYELGMDGFKVPYMWDYVIPSNLVTEKYL